MYTEEDLLPLSALQHVSYCLRQFALIHMERIWVENVRTAEGRLLHDNAHDPFMVEKRANVLISRAMPLVSYSLGVYGEADVVEFRLAPEGVKLPGREGSWVPIPIEYKRGKPKTKPHDKIQLCAQAICLEEMLNLKLEKGFLFYWEIRSREEVLLNTELRQETYSTAQKMRQIITNKVLPQTEKTKTQCRSCSLYNACLPAVKKRQSVARYIASAFTVKEGET